MLVYELILITQLLRAGQPREDVFSNKCANSSAGNFGFDKVKQNKKLASHTSLRDGVYALPLCTF